MNYLEHIYNDTLWGAAWFSWYDFPELDSVLVVGDVSRTSLVELSRKFLKVVRLEDDEKEQYSAILVFGGLGNEKENTDFLKYAKNALTSKGVLLWVADNKNGARFLCGDGHLSQEGRNYFSLHQWRSIFSTVGMNPRIYGLMPGWHLLRNVFTAECPLSENNISRLEFHYVHPERLFRKEKELLLDFANDEVFMPFANSFLMEYAKTDSDSRVVYADMYADKGRSATVVVRYSNDIVVKKPLFIGGTTKKIFLNGEDLRSRGISVIRQEFRNENIIMPYMRFPLLSQILAELAENDKKKFKILLYRFWNCILTSSDIAEDDVLFTNVEGVGPILKKAYLDMIPSNTFWVNENFVFFDQEYLFDNYPAKYVLYRALVTLYGSSPQIEESIPLNDVKEWFGMREIWGYFQDFDIKNFVYKERNFHIYEMYQQKYISCDRTVARNDIALKQIHKIATAEMFSNLNGKKIVLFGAGKYCDRYLAEYGEKYPPSFIIDNDKGKWKKKKAGIEIKNPNVLRDVEKNNFVVFICSMDVFSMINQLEFIGIKDYRIY